MFLHLSKNISQLNDLSYAFLSPSSLHSFCKICGVSVLVKVTVPGEDKVPLNVRTLQGVDLGALQLQEYNGWANEPNYAV